jgi:hypothetical protein
VAHGDALKNERSVVGPHRSSSLNILIGENYFDFRSCYLLTIDLRSLTSVIL